MISAILTLGGALRRTGLGVSIPELCDAARAAAVAGVEDREGLRRALAAALCKRTRDRAVFDAAFDAHFPPADAVGAGLHDGPTGAGVLREAELAGADAIASGQRAKVSAVTRFALTGEDLDLLLAILAAGEQTGAAGAAQGAEQEGFFAGRLLAALGWEASDAEIRGLIESLTGTMPAAQVRLLADAAARRRGRVRDAVRAHVRAGLRLGTAAAGKVPLVEKSFYLLTPDDTARLKGVVEDLCRRIRARARRKRVRFSRGKIDVQRTARRNVGTGGVPMVLAFRKRRRRRPEIVALCDLSESVRNVSRFMLQFVHALQSLFRSVRSFVFVNEVGEATALFRRHPVGEAVDRAFAGEVINVWGNSNYGLVFDALLRRDRSALSRDTTFIVLGDGRNNYHHPNAEALSEIRKRVRRVIWLTPEPESTWGFGDSEMRLYRRHCDLVRTVRNFADLKAFVDTLAL